VTWPLSSNSGAAGCSSWTPSSGSEAKQSDRTAEHRCAAVRGWWRRRELVLELKRRRISLFARIGFGSSGCWSWRRPAVGSPAALWVSFCSLAWVRGRRRSCPLVVHVEKQKDTHTHTHAHTGLEDRELFQVGAKGGELNSGVT
jgi:hypothetical protein